jgi:hypothetical protein
MPGSDTDHTSPVASDRSPASIRSSTPEHIRTCPSWRLIVERRTLRTFRQTQVIRSPVNVQVEIPRARKRRRRGEDRIKAGESRHVRNEPTAFQVVLGIAGERIETDTEMVPLTRVGQVKHARHADVESDHVLRSISARFNAKATKLLCVFGERAVTGQRCVETPIFVVTIPPTAGEQDEPDVERMTATRDAAPDQPFEVHRRAPLGSAHRPRFGRAVRHGRLTYAWRARQGRCRCSPR